MPELPEVETILRGLQPILHQKISSVQLFWPKLVNGNSAEFIRTLENQVIQRVQRHGKYLFLILDNQWAIGLHLRMTGQLFLTVATSQPDKHTHLALTFDQLPQKLFYRDIRKFGRFQILPTAQISDYLLQKKLAPDALQITSVEFSRNLSQKKLGLKAALLDQSVIAGLGNIYVDEVLMKEKLSPCLPANQLNLDQKESLLRAIGTLLKAAIEAQGTSVSDYINALGQPGKFQLQLQAYQQTGRPCPHCQTPIIRAKIAGRGTHFCPKCQGAAA